MVSFDLSSKPLTFTSYKYATPTFFSSFFQPHVVSHFVSLSHFIISLSLSTIYILCSCGGSGSGGGRGSVMVEAVEEVVTGPQDLPHIVKGKRTKRQRPQSPIPFTITTQYSSSGEGEYVSYGECINNNINNNSSSSSADQEAPPDHATTEEDDYTAKCLILLAQGPALKEPSNKFDQDHQDFGTEKFNSKRYIEAPISGNGKGGMYVYECKTCGRTFPSFQALGGHRASHKKPKNMATEEKKIFLDMSDDEEETIFKKRKSKMINSNSSSLSLKFISNRGMSSNSNNHLYKSASFPKIHECSHCGADFASGQALGGHMRRHRGAPAITNTTLSLGQLSPETMDHDSDEAEAKRTRNGLSLDLNLPAPEDDHLKESKFGLALKQQNHNQQQQQQQEEEQPILVLSTTPELVDCHY